MEGKKRDKQKCVEKQKEGKEALTEKCCFVIENYLAGLQTPVACYASRNVAVHAN
jgi:hypothetical protein